MTYLMQYFSDRWYLLIGVCLVLVLCAYTFWRLSKNHPSAEPSQTSVFDRLLIWPWLLRVDRIANEKKSWITRREVVFAILMIVLAIVAIMLTPSGRTR